MTGNSPKKVKKGNGEGTPPVGGWGRLRVIGKEKDKQTRGLFWCQ